MLVKTIMNAHPQSCGSDVSLAAAARLMSNRDCGILPVVDAQHQLVGVVTDRDVCLAVATKFRSPEEIPVADAMTSRVFTCSPDDDARTALSVIRNHGVRRLPVVTPNGSLVGIISIDDLVLHADSRRGAPVANDDVLDAWKSVCSRMLAV